MSLSRPSLEWQQRVHQRVLKEDPTAFAELCEQALPHLVSFLRSQFYQSDHHLHESVAIDCLLEYQKRPRRFDPEKLSLFAYLRMATRRDMLNVIDKHRRRNARLTPIDDPITQQELMEEDDLLDQVELEAWLRQHTELSRQEILRTLDAELTDTDKQILYLMLEGVRDSHRYGQVMGISHLNESTQRKEVKRAKDRLTKHLRRFGKRIDRN